MDGTQSTTFALILFEHLQLSAHLYSLIAHLFSAPDVNCFSLSTLSSCSQHEREH